MTQKLDKDATASKLHKRGPQIAANCDNLWALLEYTATAHPDAVHIVFRDQIWSYAESYALAIRASAGLQAMGIGKGDRVGLLIPNMPTYIILCFALWRIGAVGVGLNMLYPDARIAKMLQNVGAKMLIARDLPEEAGRATAIGDEVDVSVLLCQADASDLRLSQQAPSDAVLGDNSLAALIATTGCVPPISVTHSDLAMLQFTGGTTGIPKAAMLSHGNLLTAVAMGSSGMHAVKQADEGWSAIAPFTHVTGLILYIGVNTAFAGRCVIMERFDPAELVTQLRDGVITVLTAIPTMITALLAQPSVQEIDWDKLSLVMAGGAPIPFDLQKRFMALTGRPVLQAYGLTETGAAATMLSCVENERHLRSVGQAVPGVEISIRDLNDAERPMADGEPGEICLRGANVITGYLDDPDPLSHYTGDGFFRTGDVGRTDSEGYLYIEDRLKDIIICSGYNVYPRVVEEAVQSIAGVREVVAVGIPDAYRGETVAVALVKEGTPLTLDQIQQALMNTLSPFEMPKYLFSFDTLPKTENYKLSRALIRERLLKKVGG